MKRAAFLFALLLASALFAVTRNIEPAFACSGPPAWQQMALAEAIFEGRVTGARPTPEDDASYYRTFEVTMRVEVAYSGSAVGQEFVARARIPVPEFPQMCPQFGADEPLLNRYLVTSVHDRGSAGMVIDRWSTPFIGDQPEGEEFEFAKAIARLAAHNDPASPSLAAEPSSPRCGESVLITGERFSPDGALQLTYPGMPGELSTPLALRSDATGSFATRVTPAAAACGYELGFVEAWAAAGTPYGDGGIPLAILPLAVSEEPPPSPPDVGTGLAAITQDREVPWNDVVMVVILLLAFSGGTIAIINSTRRR